MSPDGAQILIPGRPSKHGTDSDGLEAFARTLLLHAFRIAGDPGSANRRHTDRFLEGLHNGLRGNRPGNRWLPMVDKGHAIPEAANIALALGVAPDPLWTGLDSRAQGRLVEWLSASVGAASFDNNWRLFGPTVGAFLATQGVAPPTLGAARRLALDSLARWDSPDGWVSDGDNATYDYYSSFALHFYPLMLASVFGDDDFGLRRAAARRFVATLPVLVAEDGAPVYFGRSLTYRFTLMATVSASAVAECLPWHPAAARELTFRVANYFLKRGAVEHDQTLRPGWFGEDVDLVQSYSGPGASYWVAKTFANLLLAEDHPYWADEATSPPAQAHSVLAAGMLAVSDQATGVARLANHASIARTTVLLRGENEDPLYSRLEYSSASAPISAGRSRSGSVTLVLKGDAAGPSALVATGHGDSWAASRTSFRAARGSRFDNPAEVATLARSVEVQGHDALVATLVHDGWMLHIVRLPENFPWRGRLVWSGAAVAADGKHSTSRNWCSSLVKGRGLASMVVGLVGVHSRGQVDYAPARPFASRGAVPVLAGPRSRQRRAVWFAVATWHGTATRAPELQSAPRATKVDDHHLTVSWASASFEVVATNQLVVERRL